MKKIFYTLSAITLIAAFIIFSGISKENNFTVFPNPDFEIKPFCNISANESSAIDIFLKDSQKIFFSYSLNKKSAAPYAGIDFSRNTPLDLSLYDTVKIKIKSAESENLKIVLFAFVPDVTEQNKPMSYAYFTKEIPVSKGTGKYELNLSEFQIPDWWYELNNLKLYDKKIHRDLSAVNRITIENGNMPDKTNSDTITIEEIMFTRSYMTLFVSLGIAAAICILLLFLLRNKLFINQNTKKTDNIPPHSKILIDEKTASESDLIAEYLGNHFTESDISIGKTSAETGIAEFKISRVMKDKFEKTFPQYITEIRIDEAKRLLAESDLKIIEIAFLVGFGNISHFNKVFAKQEKISPKEFRRIHRN